MLRTDLRWDKRISEERASTQSKRKDKGGKRARALGSQGATC